MGGGVLFSIFIHKNLAIINGDSTLQSSLPSEGTHATLFTRNCFTPFSIRMWASRFLGSLSLTIKKSRRSNSHPKAIHVLPFIVNFTHFRWLLSSLVCSLVVVCCCIIESEQTFIISEIKLKYVWMMPSAMSVMAFEIYLHSSLKLERGKNPEPDENSSVCLRVQCTRRSGDSRMVVDFDAPHFHREASPKCGPRPATFFCFVTLATVLNWSINKH